MKRNFSLHRYQSSKGILTRCRHYFLLKFLPMIPRQIPIRFALRDKRVETIYSDCDTNCTCMLITIVNAVLEFDAQNGSQLDCLSKLSLMTSMLQTVDLEAQEEAKSLIRIVVVKLLAKNCLSQVYSQVYSLISSIESHIRATVKTWPCTVWPLLERHRLRTLVSILISYAA